MKANVILTSNRTSLGLKQYSVINRNDPERTSNRTSLGLKLITPAWHGLKIYYF